jgi:hypothetical protein
MSWTSQPLPGAGRKEKKIVGGQGNGGSCQLRGVRRGSGDVELVVLPEEGAVGDEAAEGDTRGGGAHEVSWIWEAEEDVHQELARARQRVHLLASLVSPAVRWRRGAGCCGGGS